MNDIILSTQNGEPVASSRDVAKRFGKGAPQCHARHLKTSCRRGAQN